MFSVAGLSLSGIGLNHVVVDTLGIVFDWDQICVIEEGQPAFSWVSDLPSVESELMVVMERDASDPLVSLNFASISFRRSLADPEAAESVSPLVDLPWFDPAEGLLITSSSYHLYHAYLLWFFKPCLHLPYPWPSSSVIKSFLRSMILILDRLGPGQHRVFSINICSDIVQEPLRRHHQVMFLDNFQQAVGTWDSYIEAKNQQRDQSSLLDLLFHLATLS
ncbi:hypothetical protein Tco_0146241 [Tanacetum coccineum]